jgi:hypothetical protein
MTTESNDMLAKARRLVTSPNAKPNTRAYEDAVALLAKHGITLDQAHTDRATKVEKKETASEAIRKANLGVTPGSLEDVEAKIAKPVKAPVAAADQTVLTIAAIDGEDDLAQLELILSVAKARIAELKAVKKGQGKDDSELRGRLATVLELIGTNRLRDMSKAISALKTPDVKAALKLHNPRISVTKLKAQEARDELLALVMRPKPEALAA